MSDAREIPRIDWIDDTIPLATAFADSYYSKADGRAETGHVFINGNRLNQRWHRGGLFTIAELGFGTGLNFLETWRQWRGADFDNDKLRYISFEKFPLDAGAMRRALSRWPILAEAAEQLLALWDPAGSDFEFTVEQGQVQLEVYFGDAAEQLGQANFTANAWYLDGFSPARNPAMWGDELMAQIATHTAPGGTFATYSVASVVRRNLAAAGFRVEKAPGFAGKREMLIGHLSGA